MKNKILFTILLFIAFSLAIGTSNAIYIFNDSSLDKNDSQNDANSIDAANDVAAVKLSLLSPSPSNKEHKADLTIPKVSKKANTHTVFIRNIGKKAAGKTILGVYDGKKLIKKVNVKGIGVGKTVQVKVTLDKKFNTRMKTFRADATNKISESNKKNNIKKAK